MERLKNAAWEPDRNGEPCFRYTSGSHSYRLYKADVEVQGGLNQVVEISDGQREYSIRSHDFAQTIMTREKFMVEALNGLDVPVTG